MRGTIAKEEAEIESKRKNDDEAKNSMTKVEEIELTQKKDDEA